MAGDMTANAIYVLGFRQTARVLKSTATGIAELVAEVADLFSVTVASEEWELEFFHEEFEEWVGLIDWEDFAEQRKKKLRTKTVRKAGGASEPGTLWSPAWEQPSMHTHEESNYLGASMLGMGFEAVWDATSPASGVRAHALTTPATTGSIVGSQAMQHLPPLRPLMAGSKGIHDHLRPFNGQKHDHLRPALDLDKSQAQHTPVQREPCTESARSLLSGCCRSAAASILPRYRRLEVYLANKGSVLGFCVVYVCLNLIAFVEGWAYVVSSTIDKGVPASSILCWAGIPARGCGYVLTLNCSIIVVPVTRFLMDRVRKSAINKYIPGDIYLSFHKLAGYVIGVASLVHGGLQAAIYARHIFPEEQLRGCFGLRQVFWTGLSLILVYALMFLGSREYLRRKSFEIFLKSHNLLVVFYILLFFHGAQGGSPNFVRFAALPLLCFAFDKAHRFGRHGFEPHRTPVSLKIMPGKVTRLELPRMHLGDLKIIWNCCAHQLHTVNGTLLLSQVPRGTRHSYSTSELVEIGRISSSRLLPVTRAMQQEA